MGHFWQEYFGGNILGGIFFWGNILAGIFWQEYFGRDILAGIFWREYICLNFWHANIMQKCFRGNILAGKFLAGTYKYICWNILARILCQEYFCRNILRVNVAGNIFEEIFWWVNVGRNILVGTDR
jgi:hypothetical protein